jgi:ABC-type Fe3+-siderophore transport system permease subunit
MTRNAALLVAILLLAACATQPLADPGTRGFLWGLWDGIIAPITFIVSLFQDSTRIYAYPNSGGWYDFGYLIGLTTWAGGSHAARRRG